MMHCLGSLGSKIRILLDNAPQSFGIVAEGPTGIQKQRVQVGHRFQDDAIVVVYTNDLNLTEAQSGRMNDCIGERRLGMGVVLVHKHNGMCISKDILKSLNIAKSGWVILGTGEYDNFQDAEYRTTSDGRMRFKLGWKEFAKDFGLKVGLVVLILFHMEEDGYVKVSVDAL